MRRSPHTPRAPSLLKSLDITGARWGLEGAEALLKLRAVRANGDWAEYWHHHLGAERRRVHASRYLDGAIPETA